MSRLALHVRITGLVQGVFFRAWTAEQARALRVSGWIRNVRDGSVEGHLEGDKAAVRELLQLLHDGPPSARVANVIVESADAEGAEVFEVRH